MTKPLNTLKTSFEKIRKESMGVASEAHRIVTDGVQRLAEHELTALNNTYKSVLDAIKANKGGESIKDTAAKHLDLMQDTITKLIASAKNSLSIVGETRQELAGLVSKGAATGKVAEAELAKVTEQAKKVVSNVKAAAVDAKKQASKAVASAEKVVADTKAQATKLATTAQKDAKKFVSTAQKDAKKVVTTVQKDAKKAIATAQADVKKVVEGVKADAKAAKNRIGSVLDIKPTAPVIRKPVIVAKPSPSSRASQATSKAKQAAGSAVKVAKDTAAAAAKTVKKMG